MGKNSSTISFRITRFRQDDRELTSDLVAEEKALQLTLNGKNFAVAMRTPGSDEELVRGLLLSEGIISLEGLQSNSCTVTFSQEEDATIVDVSLPEIYLCENAHHRRSLLMNSSCGMCGKKELGDIALEGDALSPPRPFDLQQFPEMYKELESHQAMFKLTGGSHAAGVFTYDGECLCVYEDVGRHNAVDKCIGHLIEKDRIAEAGALLVSGRISFEIVSKAYRAALPILAGVSAPTSMAITKAQELGISVIGFCRGDQGTIYSRPEFTTREECVHE